MPAQKDTILKVLQDKILLKKEVFEKTKAVFRDLKAKLAEMESGYRTSVTDISKDLIVAFNDKGEFEAEFTLADETLLFIMHTNIFTFDGGHEIWKNKYIQADNS